MASRDLCGHRTPYVEACDAWGASGQPCAAERRSCTLVHRVLTYGADAPDPCDRTLFFNLSLSYAYVALYMPLVDLP